MLAYDFLVLATGARAATDDVLWKNPGTYEEGTAKIRAIGEKVQAAKSYVVGGAGMTGVETAAELKFEYKDKEVVLICADAEVLGGDSIAAGAESHLTKLGVQIKKNVKVTGSSPAADGKTEVALSDGSKITTDLYLPTIGLVPNSEYIPEAMLTDRKYLAVDEQFRAKGHHNIWGAGDVVSVPKATFAITDKTVRIHRVRLRRWKRILTRNHSLPACTRTWMPPSKARIRRSSRACPSTWRSSRRVGNQASGVSVP